MFEFFVEHIATTITLEGNSTLAITTSADIVIATSIAGDSALSLTTSCDVVIATLVAGNSVLGITTSGEINVATPIAGDSTLGITTSCDVSIATPIAGNSTLGITATCAVILASPIAGDSTLGITTSCVLGVATSIIGSSTLGITVSCDIVIDTPIAGDSSLAITTTCNLSVNISTISIAGNSVLSFHTWGRLFVDRPITDLDEFLDLTADLYSVASSGASDYGDYNDNFTQTLEYNDVAIKICPHIGDDDLEYGRENSKITHVAYANFKDVLGVNTNWFIDFNDRIFDIKEVIDCGEEHEFIRLLLEEKAVSQDTTFTTRSSGINNEDLQEFLVHRIDIWNPVYVDDGPYGEEALSVNPENLLYSNIASYMCPIGTNSPNNENIEYNRKNAKVRYKCFLNNNDALKVTTDLKIKFGPSIFDIKAVLNTGENNSCLKLLLEKRADAHR